MDLLPENQIRNKIYYRAVKPLMPRRLQIYLRRKLVRRQAELHRHVWPIDEKAGTQPPGWAGWPEGKKFALVLTHDVDIGKGQANCMPLMRLEEELGVRSSFNFVPLRYDVSPELRRTLCGNGFEVGVHGLYHDGRYYQSRSIFLERARKINHYLKNWQAVGYRAPSMCYKLDWFHELDIKYDASTFDTDPFEPHAKGVGTIFPFMVMDEMTGRSYVELPYTLPQDFTLFVLMRHSNIDLWKTKIDWVAERGGMALINTHPDYMNFGNHGLGNEEYPVQYYHEFLNYVQSNYEGQYWQALPRDIAHFWDGRYKMDHADETSSVSPREI